MGTHEWWCRWAHNYNTIVTQATPLGVDKGHTCLYGKCPDITCASPAAKTQHTQEAVVRDSLTSRCGLSSLPLFPALCCSCSCCSWCCCSFSSCIRAQWALLLVPRCCSCWWFSGHSLGCRCGLTGVRPCLPGSFGTCKALHTCNITILE